MAKIKLWLSSLLACLDPMGSTEVLNCVISVQPYRFRVLLKAELLDTEVLAEDSDHLHWLPLHQVYLPSTVEQLGVQVLQALQQKGNLVEFAVFCCGSFTVKYKQRQQLASLVQCGNLKAFIIMESYAIPEPQYVYSFL